MLNCKEFSQLASAHIDGDLSIYMRMKIRTHMFMCHDCRKFVNQLRLSIRTLNRLKSVEPKESDVEKQVKILMEYEKNKTV